MNPLRSAKSSKPHSWRTYLRSSALPSSTYLFTFRMKPASPRSTWYSSALTRVEESKVFQSPAAAIFHTHTARHGLYTDTWPSSEAHALCSSRLYALGGL